MQILISTEKRFENTLKRMSDLNFKIMSDSNSHYIKWKTHSNEY